MPFKRFFYLFNAMAIDSIPLLFSNSLYQGNAMTLWKEIRKFSNHFWKLKFSSLNTVDRWIFQSNFLSKFDIEAELYPQGKRSGQIEKKRNLNECNRCN